MILKRELGILEIFNNISRIMRKLFWHWANAHILGRKAPRQEGIDSSRA